MDKLVYKLLNMGLDAQFECPIQDISLTEDNEIMLYLETGEIFTLNIEKQESYRTCDICGKENLLEGYCIEGGREYYCSDDCLHQVYDVDKWNELYGDGDMDNYWTEW